MQKFRSMMSARMRDERGFTLVELMMVMVIIGVLAGLGFTGYNALQARADRTKADVYWRDLNTAVRMVQIEHRGWDPEKVTRDGAHPAKVKDWEHLDDYLDVDDEPWEEAVLLREISDEPDGHPVAFRVWNGKDGNEKAVEVCVWVNGQGATAHDCD